MVKLRGIGKNMSEKKNFSASVSELKKLGANKSFQKATQYIKDGNQPRVAVIPGTEQPKARVNFADEFAKLKGKDA
jgi:predicted ABC-type transport system involved in lysophospholipase L1 biosynthesis ATPase subunit